jgi:hypothetical protein
MLRAARILLALISIFAIAFVLATPDPTDDVPGILRPSHLDKGHKTAASFVQQPPQQGVIFRLPAPPSSTQRLATSELFDLACVYRC